MTIGEIFDFEIGDEFQITGEGINQPPNADRIVIIDKYYSTDNDTVFYVRFHDSYYVYIENYETHYHFWTETDTVSYTNLDTCITHSSYWVSYDTNMVSYDTINYNASEYCDSLLNGYYYAVNSFEPVYTSNIYGKGLGIIRNYYNYPSEFYMYDNILFYYKKNGISCGTPDSTTASVPNFYLTKKFKVFPVPANDFLKIKNINNIEIKSISLINTTGQVIKRFGSAKTQLDVSEISSGIYFLKISYKDGAVIEKVIIE
jgi:hypothetical protein